MYVSPLFRVWFYCITAVPAFSQIVPLVLPAGTPLQVNIEKRIRIKAVGQPITGRVVQPLSAFNKEVIPAGSEVVGHVARLRPVDKQRRFKAVLNGDFTPLRIPEIQFDQLKLPDGKMMPIKTGIASQWRGNGPFGKRTQVRKKNSFVGTTLERMRMELVNARQEIVTQINSQPKWDRLQQEAYSRLPYHPQFLAANTRLFAQLTDGLAFGSAIISAGDMEQIGVPAPDTVVKARLLSTVNSNSDPGTKVSAIVLEPLYSADRRLILPEGTRLSGTVVQAQPARWFRRSGKLRLRFQNMELPEFISTTNRQLNVEAMVARVDASQGVRIKLDNEGFMRSIEPRTRFIAPAVQTFLGISMLDETNKNAQSQSANRALRTITGASGLGIVGSAAAQFSSEAATGIGFYGAAWSVFNHVVARGHNIQLVPETPLQIRFGAAHQ